MPKTKLLHTTELVSKQAQAIARRLAKVEFPEECGLWASLDAFYNGRERGCVLSIHRTHSRPLVIVFGEHRNSDNIFIDAWTQPHLSINPPTVADFPDEAYRKRVYLRCGQYAQAVKRIVSIIENWYAGQPVP